MKTGGGVLLSTGGGGNRHFRGVIVACRGKLGTSNICRGQATLDKQDPGGQVIVPSNRGFFHFSLVNQGKGKILYFFRSSKNKASRLLSRLWLADKWLNDRQKGGQVARQVGEKAGQEAQNL